jgi:hypothetical protein
MATNQPLLALAIVGLSERGVTRLRSFLQEVADDRCSVVDLADAQAVIADVDRDDLDWVTFRAENPNCPTIVLSRQRPEMNDVIWVPKPIMEVALLEAISWAATQLRKGMGGRRSSSGSRHGADMVINPAQLEQATGRRDEDATFNVQEFDDSGSLLRGLQQAIERAQQSNCVVTLSIANEGELAVLPRDGLVAISVNEARLLDWARDEQIGDRLMIRGLTSGQQRELLGRMEQYRSIVSIDSIRWKLAAWTARGRLPRGADPEARYYLRCWPNFTRLMVLPHAVRIAALGVREPISMTFIADTLEIALADVFSFYYSAMALGLAGMAQREDDYLLANRVAHKGSPSMMQGAVRHIGRNAR